jgi:hypothetical protein
MFGSIRRAIVLADHRLMALLRRICRGGALLSLGLVASTALAQVDSAILLPPGMTLPNFDRVFPGLADAIEAGAELARTNAPAAVWYNPAGIVLTDRTIINASALGYQYTLITGNGLGNSVNSTSLLTVPGFFGVILGKEVIPWEKVRLGFAIANPISWSQGISATGGVPPSSAQPGFTTFASSSSLQSFQPTGAVSVALSSKLRLGLSLGFSYDTLNDNGQISGQTVTASNTTGSVTTVSLNGWAYQLISSLGVQYDLFPWLSVGAVVRSPSAHLFGGAGLGYDSLLTTPTGQQQVHFKSIGGDYEFFHPLEVDLGAALRFAHGTELEADLRWHLASGTYDLATFPQQTYTVVTTPNGGIPATVTAAFPDLKFGTRTLLNAGFGGRVKLSKRLTLNGGFYVAQSPIATGIRLFQSVNLYGARVGVAAVVDKLSGSIGFGYETGLTSRTATETLNFASLRIQTLTLLLSVAYKF